MLGSPPHPLICGTPVVQEHVDKPVLIELLLVNLVEAADLVVFADYAREFEPLVVLALARRHFALVLCSQPLVELSACWCCGGCGGCGGIGSGGFGSGCGGFDCRCCCGASEEPQSRKYTFRHSLLN